MLRQLQRKFILITMLLVSLILLVLFVVQTLFLHHRIANNTDDALRHALQWSENGPDSVPLGPPPDDEPAHEEQRISIPVFCVIINGGEMALIHNNVDISQNLLDEAIRFALAEESSVGSISALSLRYMRTETADGLRIAFADTTWQQSSLRSHIVPALLILVIALVCFFLVSVFFSRWATRPTERSWKQQQQFIADASHELKTPLTVMLADTDILLSHPTDTVESQRKWVEYIREEALHMKELVEDMLYLARSDGTIAPEGSIGRIALSDLCWNCLLSFESLAFERNTQLTGEISPGIFFAGHEDQLRRLVTILLDNACKYCNGGGRITLTLRQTGTRVMLSVHNTGTPIPAEALPHLFERFYRVDPSRNSAAGGHGLGLAIAASITEAHGGTISVSSTEKNGTCFTVSLPTETKM